MAFCCTGIQGTESSAVDSEANIAENRMLCVAAVGLVKFKIIVMVQINDLRFGNLVTWVDELEDYPLTISGILSKEDVFVEWVWESGETANTDCGLDNIRPIKITRKFLEKNGFAEDANGTLWRLMQTHYLEMIDMPDGFYPVYAQIPEVSSEAEQKVGLNKIQYVHQFQNLWYSLTGSELEVVW